MTVQEYIPIKQKINGEAWQRIADFSLLEQFNRRCYCLITPMSGSDCIAISCPDQWDTPPTHQVRCELTHCRPPFVKGDVQSGEPASPFIKYNQINGFMKDAIIFLMIQTETLPAILSTCENTQIFVLLSILPYRFKSFIVLLKRIARHRLAPCEGTRIGDWIETAKTYVRHYRNLNRTKEPV